jgi:hypothetical protein
MSVIEAMLRSWVCSKEPALQIKFMEICYGKVPENIRGEKFESKTTLILHYPHERPDLVQQAGPITAVNGEGTRRSLLPDAD